MRSFALCLGIALASQLSASSDSTWIYRGFQCDGSALTGSELGPEVSAAVREQIDIVCAVGVSPRVLDFFRTVPLTVVSTIGESPARYTERRVELSVSVVAYRHRPVLLHEFLHAFQNQAL